MRRSFAKTTVQNLQSYVSQKNFKREIRMKKSNQTKKRISPLTVLLSLVCVVLVAVTITSQITLNEKTIDNKNTEKELAQIIDENETLCAKIDSKNSIANVEEIAVGELGMIKLQEYQIHYVNLAQDDSVEIADESDGRSFFDGIVASFNILLEYLN